MRRYPGIVLAPDLDHHAGMVIDDTTGLLYISSYGNSEVVVVDTNTGENARTARQEVSLHTG